MKLVRLIIVATLVAGTAAQCSLDKGCSWDKLPFYCNTPAMGVLSVDYLQIKAYSGAVSCGNLFREADIGGGINTVPYVAYPKAKATRTATTLSELVPAGTPLVIHLYTG